MARFFIDHPVFAMVIAIVIVILGAVAIPGLPVATYPEVVPPVVQITAGYLGGNAQDLEKTVAQPILGHGFSRRAPSRSVWRRMESLARWRWLAGGFR